MFEKEQNGFNASDRIKECGVFYNQIIILKFVVYEALIHFFLFLHLIKYI